MKFIIFGNIFVYVICLITACNNPNSKTTKDANIINGKSKIVFAKDYHSFGDLSEGETVGCFFKFYNKGNVPLVIHNVKPTCGCVTVSFPEKPIAPGDSSEIEVHFNTKGYYGRQYKLIDINSNTNKNKTIAVSANIKN